MTVILHALSYLAVIAGFVFGLLSLGQSPTRRAHVCRRAIESAKG